MDLNMLRYFDALVSRASVTDAAAEVGVTQPGMSLALTRLRRAFGDPILVRAAGRMVATERALALLPEVREILRRTASLTGPKDAFDPATTAQRYSVAMMDSVAALLLPELVRRLADAAPGATLDCRASVHASVQRWFDDGEIDLGIGYHPRLPGHLHSRMVLRDGWALVLGRRHRLARRSTDPDEILGCRLLRVQPGGSSVYWTPLASALEASGHPPREGPTLASFHDAALVAAETEFAVAMPMRLARTYAASLPLRVVPVPIPMRPLEFGMRWHGRVHQAPEHVWFRGLVLECCRVAMAAPGRARRAG